MMATVPSLRTTTAWLTLGLAYAQVFPIQPPLSYVTYALSGSERIVVDGRLNESAWADVAWTEDFLDISGPAFPAPYFATRAKLRWDEEYLYIGAYVQDTQIWANQTVENSVVFLDNDFEVFITPDRSTHNYKEFEINAINTRWHLTLPKPYIDGGSPFNNTLPGLQSAVYVQGSVNDPDGLPDQYWTVELALPLAAYVANTTARAPPQDMDIWGINFSRVEWNVSVVDGNFVKNDSIPCSNWVWSPQWAVNMHLPERWANLVFSTAAVNTTVWEGDPQWPVRLILRTIYYYEHMFQAVTGYYTDDLSLLSGLPAFVLDGSLGTTEPQITMQGSWSFSAAVGFQPGHGGAAGNQTGNIRDDRYTWFE